MDQQGIAPHQPIDGNRVETRKVTVQSWPEAQPQQKSVLEKAKETLLGKDEPKEFTGIVSHTEEGKFITRNITETTISAVDLAEMHCLLKAICSMYLKEHVLMSLCEDKDGHIKSWHKSVTVKAFDDFSKIAKSWGLQLPFTISPEQREHDIKRGLSGVAKGVITDYEGMIQVYESSQMLMMLIGRVINLGTNSKFTSECTSYFLSVGRHVQNLDSAIKKCSCDHPFPLVRAVTFKEGVLDRK